jgi:hypothetical protein
MYDGDAPLPARRQYRGLFPDGRGYAIAHRYHPSPPCVLARDHASESSRDRRMGAVHFAFQRRSEPKRLSSKRRYWARHSSRAEDTGKVNVPAGFLRTITAGGSIR